MQNKLKLASLLVLLAFSATACMSPKWTRLIPENKDSDIEIIYPYGTVRVKTRVSDGSNSTTTSTANVPNGWNPEAVKELRELTAIKQ